MFAYVVRRLLYSIPVLIATSFIVFAFVTLTADPLGELRMNRFVAQETIQQIIKEKHLEEPIVVRFWYWVQDVFTNGFGTTMLEGQPIWPDMQRALVHTAQLLITAELLAVIIALAVGVYSAVRQYSFFDYTSTGLSFLGLATPIFWLALVLQVIFTNVYLKWDVRIFYTAGLSSEPAPGGLMWAVDRLQHLAIPIICLAIVSVAGHSRFMRASMLEVINSDYVRTARAKGLVERRVIMKHAFRNALIPVVTVVALNFGALFGGAIVTETIFSLDGMGLFFITALGRGDPYPIMAWLLVTSVMIIIGNLIADIVYGYLDPRIRYE